MKARYNLIGFDITPLNCTDKVAYKYSVNSVTSNNANRIGCIQDTIRTIRNDRTNLHSCDSTSGNSPDRNIPFGNGG